MKRKKIKSNGCTLSFYSPATLEIFFGRKTKCWTENRVQKAVTFSKIRLTRYSGIEACFLSQCLLLLMTRKKIRHRLKLENILPFFFKF